MHGRHRRPLTNWKCYLGSICNGQALSQEAGKQWGKESSLHHELSVQAGVHTGTSRHLEREVGRCWEEQPKGLGQQGARATSLLEMTHELRSMVSEGQEQSKSLLSRRPAVQLSPWRRVAAHLGCRQRQPLQQGVTPPWAWHSARSWLYEVPAVMLACHALVGRRGLLAFEDARSGRGVTPGRLGPRGRLLRVQLLPRGRLLRLGVSALPGFPTAGLSHPSDP